MLVPPERVEPVRKSQETDGGNAYSDFEDDDDPAVGSGIVETNENYDEDEYSDVEEQYQDFKEATDSAGETSLQ